VRGECCRAHGAERGEGESQSFHAVSVCGFWNTKRWYAIEIRINDIASPISDATR
jgi:hypothetical protein